MALRQTIDLVESLLYPIGLDWDAPDFSKLIVHTEPFRALNFNMKLSNPSVGQRSQVLKPIAFEPD